MSRSIFVRRSDKVAAPVDRGKGLIAPPQRMRRHEGLELCIWIDPKTARERKIRAASDRPDVDARRLVDDGDLLRGITEQLWTKVIGPHEETVAPSQGRQIASARRARTRQSRYRLIPGSSWSSTAPQISAKLTKTFPKKIGACNHKIRNSNLH